MCTEITIKTFNNDVITGRTNEFGIYYRNNVSFFPRNSKVGNSALTGSSSHTMSTYAIIGVNCGELFGEMASALEFINDGLNEKGLACSVLYYPNQAIYELVDSVESHQMDILAVAYNALAQCASVDDVISLITEYQGNFVVPYLADQPGHLFFVDRTGKSVVLEPDHKGFLDIKASNGIMTNSPNYEWHLTNLHSYANIQQFDSLNPLFNKLDGSPALSHGTAGAFGLPGDTSPASRFVKANYLAKAGTQKSVVTADDGVLRLFRIFNNFDIIPGMSLKKLPEATHSVPSGEVPMSLSDNMVETDFDNTVAAHTDHTIVKDLTNLRLYYKDWSNQSIRYVSFDDYDMTSDKILTVKMVEDQSISAQKVVLSQIVV